MFLRGKPNAPYSYLLLCVLGIISLQRRLLYKSIVKDADLLICNLLVNIFLHPICLMRVATGVLVLIV